MSPLEIRFAHAKINPVFKPFFKNGELVEKVGILQSAVELLNARPRKKKKKKKR